MSDQHEKKKKRMEGRKIKEKRGKDERLPPNPGSLFTDRGLGRPGPCISFFFCFF